MLRFGRSAAVDELLGAHRRGVEAYAKAADLLLFLLTDVPQVRIKEQAPTIIRMTNQQRFAVF